LKGTGLFGAAISAPPLSLRAISAPDYFVAEEFWSRALAPPDFLQNFLHFSNI